MKMYKADLHIHTCLSPCAGLDMSPKSIVKEAVQKEIDIAGICDHNSCENVPGVSGAARELPLHIIGGMEVTSREEVHILALFDNQEQLDHMQREVYGHLPGVNDEERFGEQVAANERDEVLGFNRRLLIGATTLSVEDIVQIIHRFEGLAIASHIDRECFGIIGQLGFIPDELELDAVEVSAAGNIENFTGSRLPVITSSDAHRIEDIGRSVTRFFIEAVNLREIKKAFLEEDGRKTVL